jgi:maleylpyruvate isomerase
MTQPNLTLYDYWRSGAAHRTRIALHLKGLSFRQLSVDLRAGAQSRPAYRDLNAQGLVPTLEADGQCLGQSTAILEWLEEVHPQPALLPSTPQARAVVRAMAAIIGSDIHPLNNLRVQQQLRGPLGASEAQVNAWISRWVREGFTALEAMIVAHGGQFAYGDTPTFVDCYLIPQVYSAERFKVDLTDFPAIRRVAAHAAGLPAFQAAHPQVQADAA